MDNDGVVLMHMREKTLRTIAYGFGAMALSAAFWIAGFYVGATRIVDEAISVQLDMAFLAHDEHAMAVAAGIWPESAPPFERDFREIVSEFLEFRRDAGCPESVPANSSTGATAIARRRILETARQFLSSMDNSSPPQFLSPYFARYGSATPAAAQTFIEDNDREICFKKAMSDPLPDAVFKNKSSLPDILNAVLRQLAKRCPDLWLSKDENEFETCICGHLANEISTESKVPEIHVGESIRDLNLEAGSSPNEIFEQLKNVGLIRYGMFPTNFCIHVNASPLMDQF